MPTFGDESIVKANAKSENNGSKIAIKDGEKIVVYPLWYFGTKPEFVADKPAEEQYPYQAAQVFKLNVWLNDSHHEALNKSVPEGESKSPKMFSFEVPSDYFKNADAWSRDADKDPIAWFLHYYHTNEEFNEEMESVLSHTNTKAGQRIKIVDRTLLPFMDENGSNRFMDMSSFYYRKLRKSYLRGGKDGSTLFMQEHELTMEGGKTALETEYFLNHLSDGAGFEISEEDIIPMGEDHWGIDPDNTEKRVNALAQLIGDEFFPLGASWMEHLDTE